MKLDTSILSRHLSSLSVILLVSLLLLNDVSALMFHLQPSAQKCLREEIHKDVLVSGDYEITEVPGQTVDLAVSNIVFRTSNM